MAAEVPELVTRKPTGKPPWPMMLLAGGEKTGKSWSAAEFSASDLVGRTFFIELGEHYADEYGAIPGVRYEIVPHDGTYRDIKRKVWAATQQERIDGKPNCIIFDSATILWDMLSKQAQAAANRRWRKNNPNKPEPDDEIQITVDLWNTAKDRFGEIINLLRQHDGPVILTARLELVTVMANGKPTTDKTWKVQAEKNLPFEVDAVIQSREPRTWVLTGLRSTRLQLEGAKPMPLPDFSVDGFLRRLGLDAEGATAPRSVTLPQTAEIPEAPGRPQPPRIAADDIPKMTAHIRQKLGNLTDAQVLEQVRGFIRRPIKSLAEVYLPESGAMRASLNKLPDHQPAAIETDAEKADRIESELLDEVHYCTTSGELGTVLDRAYARQQAGDIGQVHVSAVAAAVDRRLAELAAPRPEPPQAAPAPSQEEAMAW